MSSSSRASPPLLGRGVGFLQRRLGLRGRDDGFLAPLAGFLACEERPLLPLAEGGDLLGELGEPPGGGVGAVPVGLEGLLRGPAPLAEDVARGARLAVLLLGHEARGAGRLEARLEAGDRGLHGGHLAGLQRRELERLRPLLAHAAEVGAELLLLFLDRQDLALGAGRLLARGREAGQRVGVLALGAAGRGDLALHGLRRLARLGAGPGDLLLERGEPLAEGVLLGADGLQVAPDGEEPLSGDLGPGGLDDRPADDDAVLRDEGPLREELGEGEGVVDGADDEGVGEGGRERLVSGPGGQEVAREAEDPSRRPA